MSYGVLICRECYTERDLASVSEELEAGAGTASLCHNCRSSSFGV